MKWITVKKNVLRVLFYALVALLFVCALMFASAIIWTMFTGKIASGLIGVCGCAMCVFAVAFILNRVDSL